MDQKNHSIEAEEMEPHPVVDDGASATSSFTGATGNVGATGVTGATGVFGGATEPGVGRGDKLKSLN